MGLFDKFKKSSEAKSVNDKAPSGSHGSHFEAALGDMKLVEGLAMMAASEPDRKEDLKVETPAFGKTPAHVGIKGINASLEVLSLVVNDQFYTAYPVNTNTTKYEVIVKGVVQWKNALEGWITAKVGDATLNFFALDYYKNKAKYSSGSKLKVKLGAFAYSVTKGSEGTVGKKQKFSVDRMCAILPASMKSESAYPDDYMFQGQVMDVIEFGPNRVFKTKVAIFSKFSLEIWIYSLAAVVKGDFKKGDYISGVMWLQGSIA